LRVECAMDSKNELAKITYKKLFYCILNRINEHISKILQPGLKDSQPLPAKSPLYVASIVEVPPISLTVNYVEQACANYYAEKLNAIFLHTKQIHETSDFSLLQTNCTRMFEGELPKPANGFFALLNEVMCLPKGSAEIFYKQLQNKNKTDSTLAFPFSVEDWPASHNKLSSTVQSLFLEICLCLSDIPTEVIGIVLGYFNSTLFPNSRPCFRVQHFSGNSLYIPDDFLLQNRVNLGNCSTITQTRSMQCSKAELVANLFVELSDLQRPPGRKLNSKENSAFKNTECQGFKKKFSDFLQEPSNFHFVHCLNPSKDVSNKIEIAYLLDQLREYTKYATA